MSQAQLKSGGICTDFDGSWIGPFIKGFVEHESQKKNPPKFVGMKYSFPVLGLETL